MRPQQNRDDPPGVVGASQVGGTWIPPSWIARQRRKLRLCRNVWRRLHATGETYWVLSNGRGSMSGSEGKKKPASVTVRYRQYSRLLYNGVTNIAAQKFRDVAVLNQALAPPVPRAFTTSAFGAPDALH